MIFNKLLYFLIFNSNITAKDILYLYMNNLLRYHIYKIAYTYILKIHKCQCTKIKNIIKYYIKHYIKIL